MRLRLPARVAWLVYLGVPVLLTVGVVAQGTEKRAQDEQQVAAIQSGDGFGQVAQLLQAANHGNAAAKRELGFLYAEGSLSPYIARDPERGLQWMEEAALGGDRRALAYVGDFYAGTGKNAEPSLALGWYAKAYGAKDARGSVKYGLALAEADPDKRDLARAGRVLEDAASFLPDADPSDVRPMLSAAELWLGRLHQEGAGGVPQPLLAAAWYEKAMKRSNVDAAVALANLYILAHGLPRDLPRASSVLEAYLAAHPTANGDDFAKIGPAFAAIGAAYEELPGHLDAEIKVYQRAAALGDMEPALRLSLRLAEGTRLRRDPARALALLSPLAKDDLSSVPPEKFELYARVLTVIAHDYRKGLGAKPDRALAAKLVARVEEPRQYVAPPNAPPQPAEVVTPPDPPVAKRYPAILAPDTVQPGDSFTVDVALTEEQIDQATKIVMGDQEGGELRVPFPEGMDSLVMDVHLSAAGMVLLDGDTHTMTVARDASKSTPAEFHLRAGAGPAVASNLVATLSLNKKFLAMIKRPITLGPVAAAVSQTALPVQQPQVLSSAPRPDAASPAPAPLRMTATAPKPAGIAPDPTAQAPDVTILEHREGGSLHYTFTTHCTGAFAGDIADLPALQTRLNAYYARLATQGRGLSSLQPNADAAVKAKADAEGIGAEIYDLFVPQGFKDFYKNAGCRVHTMQVLSDDPTLPWELVRPLRADGTRADFLGLTVSIGRSNLAAAPMPSSPLLLEFHTLAVVAPNYDGSLQLAGAQREMKMLEALPQFEQVAGNDKAVLGLASALPDGIIHFAGHGDVDVSQPGATTFAILLGPTDKITATTWKGLAEANKGKHPFYFFNTCDVGQTDRVMNFVEGWAPSLLQSGASGYLGAMWAVGDNAAASFSAHFYEGLKAKLASQDVWTVADVVTQARKQTYDESHDPTALAYVLYADPYLTMVNMP